jgi:hypothetical protein
LLGFWLVCWACYLAFLAGLISWLALLFGSLAGWLNIWLFALAGWPCWLASKVG